MRVAVLLPLAAFASLQAQDPDLSISKSHTGNFTQGQTGATYSITVSNGAAAAPTTAGVTYTVTDTLPSALDPTNASGSGWGCGIAGQTVTCTRSASIPSGGNAPTITLTVDVDSGAPSSVTNTATVSGGGDASPGNNSASDLTTIDAVADLTISKSHSGNFTQGESGATYSVTVDNVGGGNSSGTITVTDTLPSALDPTNASGPGWSCGVSGQTMTCTRSSTITAGASAPAITLSVDVASNAPSSVTNTATVSGGGDINPANNSDSDPTTINPDADLTINKSHSGNFRQGQIGATYSLAVNNVGGGDSSGTITVTDTLPASLDPTNASGSGWSCNISGQTVTCTRSSAVAAGASAPTITLSVDVASNAPSSVTNTANVSGGSDTNSGNNSDSDPTTIDPDADLTINKSHAGSFVRGQSGETYTLLVSNSGGGDSSGTITVSDTLPAGLTPTDASGSGWSCPSPSGQTVTCTNAAVVVAGGSAPPIALTVDVASDAADSVTNTASVSGGADTNSSNNSSADLTNIVNPVPTLSSISPMAAIAGGSTFTLTATGSNFVSSSVVRWNGTSLSTTFVDSTELTASVDASLIATAGTTTVTVLNPSPGGGTSSAQTFTINNPGDLTITSLGPASVLAGSGGFTLTVNGANFVASSVVRWDGSDLPTSFGSATRLTATVDASRVATAATASITAFNPPPGGGTSNSATFTINNPALAIASLSPVSVQAGSEGFDLGVAGNGFVADSTVRWNGMTLPTTFLNANQLRASVSASLVANPGNVPITVRNPDPGGSVSSSVTFQVKPPAPRITTSPVLPSGATLVNFGQSLTASGGTPPYRWSLINGSLPEGLLFSADGQIVGNPMEAGTFTFTVEVIDSLQATSNQIFTLTIQQGELTITTPSPLALGTLDIPYEQALSALGGMPPYVAWNITGGALPPGLRLDNNGVVSGTPVQAGTFSFVVQVTDSAGDNASEPFALIIREEAGAALIGTDSCPNATVGIPYLCPLDAADGMPALEWSVSEGQLPAGLVLNPTGLFTAEISGQPSEAGVFDFVVRLEDSKDTQDEQEFIVTVTGPNVNINLLDNPGPAQQRGVNLTVEPVFPRVINGQLALSFDPDSSGEEDMPDDPAIQFSTGGRTVDFTVPANSSQADFGGSDLLLQTGTVAGTITLTVENLQSGSFDIAPNPKPVEIIQIGRGSPVVSSVRISNQSGSGFSIEVVGFSTSREVTQAVFRFTPRPGQNLQTNEVTVDLSAAAQGWYDSEESEAFGSQFIYVQPFTASGSANAIASVSVTLTNSLGSSDAVSVNF